MMIRVNEGDYSRKPFILFAAMLLLGMTSFVFGQVPVSRLGIEDGLSNNSVRCVYQDEKGYVWMGTYDGLNRYDGHEFTVYRNKLNDSTSLPHNYIYTLHEDKFNNLWVGTGQGVVLYDPAGFGFHQLYSKNPTTGNKQRVSSSCDAIQSDAHGNVFIGTKGWGLLVKSPEDELASEVRLKGNGRYHDGYAISAIAVAGEKVWVWVEEWGLCTYDRKSNLVLPLNGEIRDANCILYDPLGRLWIGTANGLHVFDLRQSKYVRHLDYKINQLNAPDVTSLCFDKKGKLLIGTDGGGVNFMDTATWRFDYLTQGEGRYQLSSESVNSIILDKESRIWMGTLKGGCNVIDEQRNRFVTVNVDRSRSNTLTSNFIYSFCEDKDGDLIIGTDGGGISVWNRQANSFSNYRHQSGNPSSLSYNIVIGLLKDSKERIWAATFGGGINLFNKKTGSFTKYVCRNDSTGKIENRITLMYEDHQHVIWAAAFFDGNLFRYDETQNRFVVFDQNLDNLISLSEDKDGNLWGGNSNQLIRIDRTGRQHIRLEMGKPIRAIHSDRKGRLWLGTEGGGLVLFDPVKKKVIRHFSTQDGLSNNAVLNILEDEMGNLWLGTFNGLSKFNPSNSAFTNYYQSDGLQSNQFSYNAARKLRDGSMVLGGINGFNLFKPAEISPRKHMPGLQIHQVLVNNAPLQQQPELISSRDAKGITSLEIPYKKAVFSVKFGALEYSSPEKIRYASLLEGWDEDWIESGNIRNVNYNNLTEGKYTLKIKNTNSNGEWNENYASLQIVILPPWYRSIWAYLCYLCLATYLGYLIYRYQQERSFLRYQVKLAEYKAEKEREVGESRQSFFTNITHEFRTPLTMILNPLKEIMQGIKQDVKKEDLNLVYRNSQRLLSLVDQLLLFRKTESEMGSLVISEFDLHELCRQTFDYFEQEAATRGIEYVFDYHSETKSMFGDREKLEIVFYNLLSNAIKYAPDQGKVVFKVTSSDVELQFAITDNGPGIYEDAQHRLFDKFYQGKGKGRVAKNGFGIGLYLAKQLVDGHKGSIQCNSVPGQGTTFVVKLLNGKQHFGDVEVIDNDVLTNNFALASISNPSNVVSADPNPEKSSGLDEIISETNTVLIADDNNEMRDYLIKAFQGKYKVYEASDGETALRIAREKVPDIIISDVFMEGKSGIDLCRAIKESEQLNNIPVILMTGSNASDVKLEGVHSGADDYITKPFDLEILQARVASLIRKQKDLQKYFYNEITHQSHSLTVSSEYKEFLESCIRIVEKNLDQEEFTIQQLASEIGMSHSKLYKRMKTISGLSANAFIRYIRLRKAAELFINTDFNVNQAAFYVGMKDVKYFRDQFSKTFGMNPSAYIKQYRNALGKQYKLNENLKREGKS